MLVRFLYAELPRPSLDFVARDKAIYEWAAVRRPMLSFVAQDKISPVLEWAAVRHPDLLFASMPRMDLEFVPFDVELYDLLEAAPRLLAGQAEMAVSPTARLTARLAGQAEAYIGCLGTLSTTLRGSSSIHMAPGAVFRTNLKGDGQISMPAQARLALRAQGAAPISVQAAGRLAARFKGVADIATAAHGRLALALKGAAHISLAPGAVVAQPLFLSGAASIFTAAFGRAPAVARGEGAISVSPAGILRRRLQGQAAVAMSALATFRTKLKGSASVQILPQGVLRRRLQGSAGVSVSPTATMTLGGGTPPQTQTTVVRVDAVGDFRGVFGTSYQTADDSIRIGYSAGSGASRALMRFPLPIPRNAAINSALVRFVTSTLQGSGPFGTAGMVAVINQAAPSSTAIIDAAVSSTPNKQPVPALGVNLFSVADILGAIVTQPTWTPGNYVGFAFEGTSVDSGQQANVQGLYTQFTTTVNADRPMLTVEWSYPSLQALTLSTTSAYDDTLNNEVVAAIGGTSGGSLSVNDPSGQFATQGTNLVAQANLTAGTYPISITETLAGSPNSPRTTSFTIIVDQAPIFRFTGAATGTNTATIPTHRSGDIIFAFAFRDGSNTLPTIPSGWTAINNPAGANTCSHVLVYRVATGSTTTTGTFTSATSLVVQVYRPKPGYAVSIGASTALTGTAATVSYGALTLQTTNGSSWVIAFAGHRSTNTALETPPQGTTLRANVADATDEASGFDTNGGVSSWSQVNVAVGGTASGWRTAVAEIKLA